MSEAPERIWLDKTHRWLDGATNTSDDACMLDWRVNEVKVSHSTEYARVDPGSITLSADEARMVREALKRADAGTLYEDASRQYRAALAILDTKLGNRT